MTTFFVDTSAAAKRYINEQGSRWVRNNLDPSTGNVVIVSELMKPEIEGTLSRYQMGKHILTRAHVMLRNEFLRHFEKEYLVVTVGASLLDYATRLIRKHFLVGAYRLRTLDAIHLACALEARAALNEPIVFVVTDERLRNAALAEGFYVENPEAYP